MCGIGGIISKNGGTPATDALERMKVALGKRGPDGAGMYCDGPVGFVHTRLAIIDPAGGQQPISDSKGRVLVFNGEIYNYLELRQSLATQYQFKTYSDSETILAAYDVYGLSFINHLRGMYAFALYDAAHDRVVLARDPFGIKPLYVCENSEGIAFASEPKALIAAGVAHANMDTKVLRRVLTDNYNKGTDTPYPSIKRMEPGELRVIEGGKVVSATSKSFLQAEAPFDRDDDVALIQLESVFLDSVDMHCRSDVGYGVFLSGGVDSSAIMAALAQRTNMAHIHTYTAYFDTPDAADERQYARAVLEQTGAQGTDVIFGAEDFKTLLPAIAAYMDDPVADYAILPTWKLASVAAREQKVVLCGEGGDELFAGYGRYRSRPWKDWRGFFQHLGEHYPSSWTSLQRRQARDIDGYLPCDLLIKLDTCLMAHGLEGRTPFLDSEVANFAFSLPDRLKLHGRDGKYLLKQWLDQKIPEAQPFRKKQGFTVPVGQWMSDDAAQIGPLLTQNTFVRDLLSRSEVRSIPSRMATPEGAKSLWSLLYLTLWYMGKAQGAANNLEAALAA